MRKFILSSKEHRVPLMVSADVHRLVCLYAEENSITLAEATYNLLGKALAQEVGLDDRVSEALEKD